MLVLAYLGNLSQLDEKIRSEAEDKIADYYMHAAELQIMQSALAANTMSSLTVTAENLNEAKFSYGEVN